MTDLPDKLKQLRKNAGLTQKQVANAVGVERSAYTCYEIGKTMPKPATLQRLARLYKTNVDSLLGNDFTSEEDDEILKSPDLFGNWYTDDKLNQLSDFEKSVILRIRLMSSGDKKKLMEYLDTYIDNQQ